MITNMYLYVLHPLSQPEKIEDPILSLEYKVVWPNEKEDEYVVLELDEEINCVGETNLENVNYGRGDNKQKEKLEEGTTELDEGNIVLDCYAASKGRVVIMVAYCNYLGDHDILSCYLIVLLLVLKIE